METIIASCISAFVTLVVCLITNNAQAEKTRALMEYQIGELRKQVEKHNGLIERMYLVEGDMRETRHRVDRLESEVKINETE